MSSKISRYPSLSTVNLTCSEPGVIVYSAFAIAGDLGFNPLKDSLKNENGEEVMLDEPSGFELPSKGFDVKDNGYKAPAENGLDIDIEVDPNSERIELLTPFNPWNGENISGVKLLIKAYGKCTTDHISMAGPWLKYRGHLDNISNNTLTGAVNSYNKKTNNIKNQITGDYGKVPDTARGL